MAPDEEYIINSYRQFVETIRNIYPEAWIICALGNMDITQEGSKWPDYVEKTVKDLDDEKILTFFMPYKNTPGHPKIEEQQEMADSLIQFIQDNIGW